MTITVDYIAEARRHERGCESEELGTRRVRLSYDPADPYAVALEVFHRGAWARWVFARSLLATGSVRGDGAGAVYVGPYPDRPGERVAIILRTEPGAAFELLLRRAELTAAVARFDALVPVGSESERIDWTRELAFLAGGDFR